MGYDAIIIGAGHNGLTCAASLGRAGHKVLVLERRDRIGGLAAGEEFHPGYRTTGLLHDTTGVRASVVEMLELERHGLKLLREPAPIFAPQRSGPGLLLHRDGEAARAEIAAHSAQDADRYAAWRGFLSSLDPVTSRLLNSNPPDMDGGQLGDLIKLAGTGLALRRLGPAAMMDVLRVAPMCAADWMAEWFETDLLRALLAAPSMMAAWMGPWSAGSNTNLLMHEAAALPGVQGGPAALIEALAASARAHGVEIRTSAAVARVRQAGKVVVGVTLEKGEEIEADAVAASCDPRHALLDLVDPRRLAPQHQDEIRVWRGRGTTAKVHLALDGPLEFSCRPGARFEHIRVCERIDDMERAYDAVKYGEIPRRPHLDIRVPTLSDPALAPQGHHVASILVHQVPFHLKGGWTPAQREALGAAVLETLAEVAPSAAARLVAMEVLSPADLTARYGLVEGHVHHGEHALDQLLFMRPGPSFSHYSTPIDGLYLCGSGSHPGGGITCAPGALAAAAILKAL